MMNDNTFPRIILVDVNRGIVDAWKAVCSDLAPLVVVHHGSIFELDAVCGEAHAIVSPANSFGFMDGGLDLAISRRFGWHIQERLRQRILARPERELLVGNSEIIPTGNDRVPFVISAPTMRVPMALYGPDEVPLNMLPFVTVNPYLAMRAVLLAVRQGALEDGSLLRDKVSAVAVTGLGTFVGAVSHELCARQMRKAIEDIVLGKWKDPQSWHDAQSRHMELYTDLKVDIQGKT